MNFWMHVLPWAVLNTLLCLALDRKFEGKWRIGNWPIVYAILSLMFWMWMFRDLARSSTG